METTTVLWTAAATVAVSLLIPILILWLGRNRKNRLRREFRELHRFEGHWAKK